MSENTPHHINKIDAIKAIGLLVAIVLLIIVLVTP